MAKKTMNNVSVFAENINIVYEGSFGQILREINSLNYKAAFILVGILAIMMISINIAGVNYILGTLFMSFWVFIFWFIKSVYEPKKGFLTVIGVKKKPPSDKNKYFLHLGDAVRAINEIPVPAKVKSDTPEKLEYPIMIDFNMALRHMFAVGTTGSGKTTFSIYLLQQHLGIGGGGLIVDGKGDMSIYTDIVNTCVHFNREDDMFVINFNAPKESNKMNPLLVGDVDDISDLVGNLLESGGDNAIWAGRALNMMNGLMSCLVPLRDADELYDPLKLKNNFKEDYDAGIYKLPRDIDTGEKDGSGVYQPILTFKVLSRFLDLDAIRDLYFRMDDRNRQIEKGEYKGKGEKKPIDLSRLASYLASCSTSTRHDARNKELEESSNKMHGNSNVMWGEAIDLFMGTYGDIFNTDVPDLTMQDVVYNSRFLYVLLPATKKNQRTLSMLGKIILALVKQAVATLLGDKISGNIEQRRASLAIRPIIPFIAIMDEYGAYAVQGFDNVLAQARSLRVCVIIEVQEIASLEKGGEIDKKRLLGNTAIKVMLKVEDLSTAKELVEMMGTEQRGYVRQASQGDTKKTFDVQERNIVDTRMLSEMVEGHGYVRYSGETTPMLGGYYSPPNSRYIQEFNTFGELTLQNYVIGNITDDKMREEGLFDILDPNDPENKKHREYEQAKNDINRYFKEYKLRVAEVVKLRESKINDIKYGPTRQAEALYNATADVQRTFNSFVSEMFKNSSNRKVA